MYYVILAIHLLIALLLGIVVLLQRSKGGGLAGAFGGVGAGEAMFGSHGVTTMLHKTTIYLAIAFMLTSLGLVYLTAQRSENRTGPARAVGGQQVLPVGSADVAAPADAAGTATIPVDSTTDGVVPVEESGDDIVPAAGDETTGESEGATEGGGEEEGGTEEGGR
jgi:preprotein translocase subunit SecG